MRRSLIALGASVLALALNAAPAAAQTGDPGQQVGDSTGAAQVGAVQADVPVRVLSDGENAEPAGVTATPQDSGDSTAAAQVGSADVNAPVRVLSDGDNGGGEASQPAGSGTEQTADDSSGSAQIEPADVSAPIRVLSEGDDGVTATAADTSPNGDPPAGGDGTTGDTVPAIGGGGPADDTTPAVDQLPALDPVAEAEPGNGDGGTLPDGGELLPIAAGDVAGDTAGSLPLTGLAVASLVLTGMALIAGGGALHCMPSRH
jgi:hypothetical protein